MRSVKFLRATDINGEPKKLTAEQYAAWELAGFVGHMLDSVLPMSFPELVEGCNRYNVDFSEPAESVELIAYQLVLLLQVGLVEAVKVN
jgi:hypothetical protein